MGSLDRISCRTCGAPIYIDRDLWKFIPYEMEFCPRCKMLMLRAAEERKILKFDEWLDYFRLNREE